MSWLRRVLRGVNAPLSHRLTYTKRIGELEVTIVAEADDAKTCARVLMLGMEIADNPPKRRRLASREADPRPRSTET